MWKRLFEPALAVGKDYFLGVIAASTWFLFDVYSVLVFKQVGDYVQDGQAEKIRVVLISYSLVFLLFYVRKYITRTRTWARSMPVLSKEIRKKYMHIYFMLSPTEVEKIGTGRIINIFQEGINKRVRLLMDIQLTGPNLIIKFGLTLYLLAQMGIVWLLIFLVILICLHGLVHYFNKKVIDIRWAQKRIKVAMSKHFVMMLMSKHEILQTANQQSEIDKYGRKFDEEKKFRFLKTGPIYFMFNFPLVVVQSLGIVSIVYAYVTLQAGTFSYGLFTALLVMVGYLVALMLASTTFVKESAENLIHIEKLRDVVDTTPIIAGLNEGQTFRHTGGEIVCKDITFAYDAKKPLFDEFSIQLMGGKKTAFVGPSGSGKSTLIKLLAGYIQADSGEVIVDRQSLTSVALRTYYNHIGYLTQEPQIFDGTVRENLLYAVDADGVDESKLQYIIGLAKCEFVYDLGNGLDTEIGERGVRLSGGQKQRLAIAKVFLKDPKIIILDEPTAALDSFSEETVTAAMHTLFNGRTVLIIAHRLQTVKEADDIIVLDTNSDGHAYVRERGTHEELVAKNGYYKKMLDVQTGF